MKLIVLIFLKPDNICYI